ncbi:MAG: GH3 auxin-responsive promoter family protein [Dehalococcoidia bacterium]|nr:GH3 auxin-responsive promoter family protein [Dehalococcoidia bacterium]
MRPEDRFFQGHDKTRIWNRYCGFLDLSKDEFMKLQERLLLEQIGLVVDSPLGRILMKNQRPIGVEEFRRVVPLTTYKDYAPYIGDGQEEFLAGKPHYWVHTSYTKGAFKRVPWTEQFVKAQLRNIIATLILSSATDKGDIQLAPGCRILAILPEKPFVSAHLAHGLLEQFSAKSILPLDESDGLRFRDKMDAALRMAISADIDYIITMTSSLLPMERRFQYLMESRGFFSMLPKIHPMVLLRVLKDKPSRFFGRKKRLLPKDLWSVKGIVAWGADSNVFQDHAMRQWGKPLFQFYGSSESGLIAMQDWQKDRMNFLHDSVFLEFIPEEDVHKKEGASTLLINDLEDGKVYEPVITSFYGMPLLRYRQGDLIRIVSRGDGVKDGLPQMVFHDRADDIIDLFGISRLNTKTVSEALVLTGIPMGHWSARKEFEMGKIVLSFYIELDEDIWEKDLERRIHRKLKEVDGHYREAVLIMAYNPVRIIPLARGAFERYSKGKGKNGHGPELQKLPQMNLSDAVISDLLRVEM